MKWSSGSTSRAAFFFAVLGLGVFAGVFAGGCAGHKAAPLPPPLRGSVNLNLLVRRHPGWSGIGQYDAALRRLEQASRSLPPAGTPDRALAVLPALPADVGAGPRVAADSGAVARRLDATQQALLDSLRARREAARVEQTAQDRDGWLQEARLRFPNPTAPLGDRPDLSLQLLEANVASLTQTVNNWKLAPPPAPRLVAVQDLLARNKARLEVLLAARAQDRATAQSRFVEARRLAHQSRLSYIQTQADALNSRLSADDNGLVAAQAARLTRQRAALLSALAQPAALAVPPAGYAGEETLPRGPGAAEASLSEAAVSASETRLRAQRARWIKFLYDDTQAAALDVAGQRRWDVTFGPPRPGDRDLTGALAQAMAGSVWRL